MKTKSIVVIFLVAASSYFLLCYPAFCEEPKRDNGLSAHWVPARVASIGKDEKVQEGFLASHWGKDGIIRMYCSTPTDLLDYFNTFPSSFKNNGIWIVVTNPDAYSPDELKMKDELIKLCKEKNIILFICRGSELPDGWKQYSPAPK